MGKKRRRLESRAKRQALGEESPPKKRKTKWSEGLLFKFGDSLLTSFVSRLLHAIGL